MPSIGNTYTIYIHIEIMSFNIYDLPTYEV